MRKMISAAAAGLAIAGGAALMSGAAEAQPYGYNYGYGQPGYYGYNNGYAPYGSYAPYLGYNNGYNNRYYGNRDPLSAGLAVLGSVLGGNGYAGGYGYGVPVDRYGPDPNGMIGPDGRRIKCKLRRSYDSYYGRYVTRRECRSR
jgi:hypothetical protein